MPADPYADLAAHYDRFFGAWGEHDPAVAAFFRQLWAEHGVRRVLDCACGTGHDLALFAALGCEVVGSDISVAMLAQAARHLAGAGLNVPLHRADYRELPAHFAQPFEAVVCLSSSLLHMPDEAQALRALTSMGAALRPGGLLVLTQGTTDRQWRDKPRFLLAADTPDYTRLFVIDYVGEGARYNIIDITRDEGHNALQSWSVDYACVLLRDDYARLLPAAGFTRATFYGGYDRQPYDIEASRRLIVVAVR